MNAYQKYLNELRNRNKLQFEKGYTIKWASSYNAQHLQEQRDALISEVVDSILFKGTKPYYSGISEGCRRCGEGTWSCLFITGRCNASCFYCPAPQMHDEEPVSQGLHFPDAAGYAAYIKYFGFNAVAFSGGEPLLFPDRLLDYLKEVRKTCSSDIYTWMYTNGLLANREIFAALAATGLDEVRFDIGATSYLIDKVIQAVGIIPNVTVEIPAIPEYKDKLISLLPQLEKAGVKNLNLHQLRLTPFNASKLLKRDYTFLSAEKPVVAESEITALEVMRSARKNDLSIGIHYCSFHFKHRFQQAGFRRCIARKLSDDMSTLTEQGYLREEKKTGISYSGMRIIDADEQYPGEEVLQIGQKHYALERFLAYELEPDDKDEMAEIRQLILYEPPSPPEDSMLFNLWRHEYIERGLREY